MKSKIGTKLLVSYFLLVIITLVIVGALLNPLLKNYLFTAKKNDLVNKANEIAAITQKYNDEQMDEATFNQIIQTLDKFIDTRICIIDKQGLIVASSQTMSGSGSNSFPGKGASLSNDEVGEVLSGQTVIKEGMSPRFNMPMISVAVPISTLNAAGKEEVSGAVFTFAPVSLVTTTLNKAYYYLGISSIIAALLAAGLALYLSRKISRPLRTMNQVALTMAQGDYDTVIEPIGDDELGELAISLNYLARQLSINMTALEHEKGKLELIVHSINEGLIAIDRDGTIILANPMIENLFMATTKRLLSSSLESISPFPELTKTFQTAMENEVPIITTFGFLSSTYRIVVSPIKKEGGNTIGAVGILQDISEMEKVEHLRRDFVANVSHELRAPVTVIRGYIECLLDGVTDNTPDYYYTIIKEETLRLERLIKDLMDLSLLQSGKVELFLEEVNLNTLVFETVQKFLPRARSKDLHLLTNTDSKDNITVYCDPDRIEQLLIILLDNALKFTPPGGTVEVNLNEKNDTVDLLIKDSGIGIPEEDLHLIWERFYKADKSRTRQFDNGTGLGLSIAKQIADLHQAEIKVESPSRKGSTFTLQLKSKI